MRAVCRRLRVLVDHQETVFSIQSMSEIRKRCLSSRSVTKYCNLRVLDLTGVSKTSLGPSMADSQQRKLFAQAVAVECQLLQQFKVEGITGCKWLSAFVRSRDADSQVRHVYVNVMSGFIGCIEALIPVLPLMERLSSLSLEGSVRRSSRLSSVTQQLLQNLPTSTTSFHTVFRKPVAQVDATCAPRLAGMQAVSLGTLSPKQILDVRERNPGLRMLKVGVTSDSLLAITLFRDLERLSLEVNALLTPCILQQVLKDMKALLTLQLVFAAHRVELSGVSQCTNLEVLMLSGRSVRFLSADALLREVSQMFRLKCVITPEWREVVSGDRALVQSLTTAAAQGLQVQRIETATSVYTRSGSRFLRQVLRPETRLMCGSQYFVTENCYRHDKMCQTEIS